MDIDFVRTVAGLDAIEADWRRLAVARGDAFLTPEWFRAAAEGLGGFEPLVATAHAGGGLAGLLALTLGGRRSPAAFPAAAFGDRFGLLSRAGDADAVATALSAHLRDPGMPRVLSLRHVEAGEAWPETLAGAASPPLAVVEQTRAPEPFIPLEGLDWDGYLAERSSSFRKRVRYLERSLARDPGFRVREAGAGDVEAGINEFFRLHDLRWEGRAESSLSGAPVRRFLGSFAERAAANGWLRLRFLEVDGSSAAALLGWRIGDRYAFYQAGFDPAFAKRSVGMLLVALTIRAAIEEGAAEFDFLLGAEDYKWRFASEARDVRTLTLVPRFGAARARASTEAWARRHSGAIRRSPRLTALAKRFGPGA